MHITLPGKPITNNNRALSILKFILFGLILFVHLRLYVYAFDDAYIHFRVARNFVETGFPYYNVGEMLKVSTSSGWVVFLSVLFALAQRLGFEAGFPLVVGVINAVISCASVVVYGHLVEQIAQIKLSTHVKTLFGVGFIAILLPSSIGLMETPMAILLVGLGLGAVLQNRSQGFVFLASAVYFRLELILLVGGVFLWVMFSKRVSLWTASRDSLLGILPFILFDLIFYRTIYPHSVVAKSQIYSLSGAQTLFYVLFYSLPQTLLPTQWSFAYSVLIGFVMLSMLIIVLWAVFRVRIGQKRRWPIMFLLWGLGVMVLYAAGRVLIFDWYIPLYVVPLFVACFLYFVLADAPANRLMLFPLGLFAILSVMSIGTTLFAGIWNPSQYLYFESGSRVRNYLLVGKVLREAYPNADLMTSEIGGLGYAFTSSILDAVGLASVDALTYHPLSVPDERKNSIIGAIPPAYVVDVSPDIIVTYDTFAQALLRGEVLAQYTEVRVPAYMVEDRAFARSELLWENKYLRVFIHHSLSVDERVKKIGEVVLP